MALYPYTAYDYHLDPSPPDTPAPWVPPETLAPARGLCVVLAVMAVCTALVGGARAVARWALALGR